MVAWFEDDAVLPLDRAGIQAVLEAAELDWSEIDPSIFGTLFERSLDPDTRAQQGSHYTDADKIMRIVHPVVVRPLEAEWEAKKQEIREAISEAQSNSGKKGQRKAAQRNERQSDEALAGIP